MVDTRNKRFSIMTLGRTAQPVILTPDGTIAQADRQALLWGYSGILWDSPVIVDAIDIFLFDSYIELETTFESHIETVSNFDSYIETESTFKSEVK